MSSKQVARAVSTAKAICRDVAGNLLAGQELRVVAHLQNLLAVLEGIEAKLDAGNDVRAEMKLDKVLKDAYDRLDTMPAFDDSIVDASMERWKKLGVSFGTLLQPMGDVHNPEDAQTPEGKAAMEAIREALREHGAPC